MCRNFFQVTQNKIFLLASIICKQNSLISIPSNSSEFFNGVDFSSCQSAIVDAGFSRRYHIADANFFASHWTSPVKFISHFHRILENYLNAFDNVKQRKEQECRGKPDCAGLELPAAEPYAHYVYRKKYADDVPEPAARRHYLLL